METLIQILKTLTPYWEDEDELSKQSDEDLEEWPADDIFAAWNDTVRDTLGVYCGTHLF